MIALAVIVLIIFGICMITVGAEAEYIGGELKASATVCGIKLQLYPREKKPAAEDKPKEEKKSKQDEGGEKPAKPKRRLPKLQLNRDEILELIKRALNGLGKFGKVTVNRFLLHVLVGGEDPYNTAITYGWLNAALASLAPACSSAFIVKNSDIQTGVDFAAESTEFDAALGINIRLGQIFRTVFSIIFGAAAVLIKNRIRLSKEKKHKPENAEAAAPENNDNNDNNEKTAPEERKE